MFSLQVISPLFFYCPLMIFINVQVPGVDDDDVAAAARLWRRFFYLWISMLETCRNH